MKKEMVRVQKWLASQGIGSRRTIERMIADKRIKVNGETVLVQGKKIEPEKDVIKIDEKKVESKETFVYYWLNKPVGIISAVTTKTGETTVCDLVPRSPRVYPVGRLDKDSKGLLMLTNDGTLTHRLTHPKFHIKKTYQVRVYGVIREDQLERLRNGIFLSEGITAPANVVELGNNWLEFTIHEGKHRQIRRMCQAVGLSVLELIRIKFGTISLGKLTEGTYRIAKAQEIDYLKKETGLLSRDSLYA